MLASPRFVDLVAVVGGGTPHWRPGSVAVYANQLSALPSLHIAWAVWSSIVVWRLSRRWSIRAAAAIYPMVTTFAVMATGNHYLADAVTGALLAGLAVAAADRLWAARRPSP
jgi:diacylglycerol O-acyltransferase